MQNILTDVIVLNYKLSNKNTKPDPISHGHGPGTYQVKAARHALRTANSNRKTPEQHTRAHIQKHAVRHYPFK